MNLKTKIFLDKISFLIVILSSFLRYFYRLIFKLPIEKVHSITFIKFAGGGSLISLIPLFNELQQQNISINILTAQSNKYLEVLFQNVDFYYINDKNIITCINSGLKWVFFSLSKPNNIVVDCEINSNLGFISSALSLKSKAYSFSTTPRDLFREFFLDGTLKFKWDYPRYKQIYSLITTPGYSFEPKEYLQRKKNITDLKILLCPTCSDLEPLRRVNNFFWNNLAVLIYSKYGIKPLLVFQFENDYLKEDFSKENIVVCITPNFSEFYNLILESSLVITIDSLALHLAEFTGTPSISLFGPSHPNALSELQFSSVHYKNLSCSPCVHQYFISPCKSKNICMDFNASEVFCDLERILDDFQ
jgi:ADP-heptose:LPS heptosyltransferase